MGFLSNIGDKFNIGDGTTKCKQRAKSFFSGDPGMLEASINMCKQSNPAQYQTAGDFVSKFSEGNVVISSIEPSKQDTAQAIEQRDKAIKIGAIILVSLVLIVVMARWIKKSKK